MDFGLLGIELKAISFRSGVSFFRDLINLVRKIEAAYLGYLR